MAKLALVFLDNESSEKVQDKGAAMLSMEPVRVTVLSARTGTAANRVLATAMVMLAAAIAKIMLLCNKQQHRQQEKAAAKPKTLKKNRYDCLLVLVLFVM
jgi:Pyruvate/2-oxoacid:ferredoxin oxidoreductase gamma subunit